MGARRLEKGWTQGARDVDTHLKLHVLGSSREKKKKRRRDEKTQTSGLSTASDTDFLCAHAQSQLAPLGLLCSL